MVGRERDAHRRLLSRRGRAGARWTGRTRPRGRAARRGPRGARSSATLSAVNPNAFMIVPAGRARPEPVEPEDRALVAGLALPAQRDARLDGHALAHGRRQDALAVGRVLGLEALPAREAHDAGRDARRPRARRPPRRTAPARTRCRPGSAPGVPPAASRRTYPPRRTPSRAPSFVPGSVGSFWRVNASATGPGAGAVERRPLGRQRPGRDRLVPVAGPDEPQVRDRAQRRVVLDRLVRGAVLAQADGVVRPDVGHVQPGQGGQADGAAHVVAEGQERGAVREEPAVVARCRWRCRPSRARGRRSGGCGPRARPRSGRGRGP